MTIYNYVALKDNKETINGKIEASNLREARANIRKLNLIPITITEESKEIATQGKGSNKKLLQKLKLKEKLDFTSTFTILMQAGVPIMESLIFIEKDADSKNVRAIANEIRRQIISGSTFADTIAKYAEVFDPLYVGLARAGEDSGEMEKTLDRVIKLLKKQEKTSGKVQATMMYPVFVILLATIVIIVMLTVVFPAFKDLFSSMEGKLPLPTVLCMSAGTFMREHFILVGMFFALIIYSIFWAIKTPSIKRILDSVVLGIPIFSDLVVKSNFSNFTAVLQIAYESGIPIVDCLYLAISSLTNQHIREKIHKSIIKVQQGTNLSVALKTAGVVPKMVLFMIATGEQSGRLGELLNYSCEYIDKELDKIIDTMTKMIEPIMLVVLGGIVLFLALSLYLPLFQSYQMI